MIDEVNTQFLSEDQRRNSLTRAINSQPFFHYFEFPILGAVAKQQQYEGIVAVNKDFWLTEIVGNFGEVQTDTGSFFNVSITSLLNDQSLWKFLQGIALPSGQVMTEARNNTAWAGQDFDDRQHEYIPYLLKRGDRVQANLFNLTAKGAGSTAHIVLKGYYTKSGAYLNPNLSRGVTESLARPIRFETWPMLINNPSGTEQDYVFTNDRYARVILGFGIRCRGANENEPTATIQITDTFRNLTYMERPLPIEFVAPFSSACRDTHIYYLPVEAIWEPFSAIKCAIDMITLVDYFDLIMYTRTV